MIVRSKSIVAVNICWWRGNHYNDVANISTFLINRKKKLSSILMFPFIFRFCESVHLNGMTRIRIKWNRRRKERRNMTKKRVKYRRAYRGIIYMNHIYDISSYSSIWSWIQSFLEDDDHLSRLLSKVHPHRQSKVNPGMKKFGMSTSSPNFFFIDFPIKNAWRFLRTTYLHCENSRSGVDRQNSFINLI